MGDNTGNRIHMTAFEKLPTPALRQLIQNDCNGTVCLSTEEILRICEILVSRDRNNRQRPERTAEAAWERFRAYYNHFA